MQLIKQLSNKFIWLIAIVVLTIILVSVISCTKQNPFIPKYVEPVDKDYVEITFTQVDNLLFSYDLEPTAVIESWQGQGIIVKDIEVDDYALSTLGEGHIYFNNIKCIPRDLNDLLELKEGDVIDLTGVVTDIPLMGNTRTGIVVLAHCQFLPAGVYPLPLPGSGGAPIGGY